MPHQTLERIVKLTIEQYRIVRTVPDFTSTIRIIPCDIEGLSVYFAQPGSLAKLRRLLCLQI